MSADFPLERVLELACSAQRTNMGYLKDAESVFDSEGKFVYLKHTNKTLIRKSLGLDHRDGYSEREFAPMDLFVEDQDRELAAEIRKYFRRLMFAAVKGDNEFQTEVNVLLNSETIPGNKIGFIACLPSVYARDVSKNRIEKRLRNLEEGHVGDAGEWIFDRDCEILTCVRSKNFDAWNVDAIIDNKMVSWFSKAQLSEGACVLIKGKVKDHSTHWKFKNSVTRLHYVKAAQ